MISEGGPVWKLQPGDTIRRTDLHQQFGGNPQAGISPSAKTPNLFIFTDPRSGTQHGYVFDGWSDDGTVFYYTGAGKLGDQQLAGENLAIVEHAAAGRTLRVFDGVGGMIRYVGAFTIDLETPYDQRQAPESGGGPMRSVLVFHLRPEGPVWRGDVDFDEQWDALCAFLRERPWWESLVQGKRYEVREVQPERVVFVGSDSDRVRTATKSRIRSEWEKVVAASPRGVGPTSTRSRSSLLAQLPNIEYTEPLQLYYVSPASHPMGEPRRHEASTVSDPSELSGLARLAYDLYLELDYLEDMDWLLRDRRQLVFFGPPGTGKTFVAEAYARWFTGAEERVETLQFHASYAYEDFIEGIRPVLGAEDLRYALVDGTLKRFAAAASVDPDHAYVLIIDEINRANLARVFGELLYLLEYRERSVRLPYSGERFSLPPNLYLIGTMNTADRSIALVDFALRRRFHFVEFPADAAILRRWLERNNPPMLPVADLLAWVNNAVHDHDFAIGFSYFMRADLDETLLRRIWSRSILPALAEYYFDNADRRAQFSLEAVRAAVTRRAAEPDDDEVGENDINATAEG